MFPAGTRFTWAQFKEAVRAHHIPARVIRRKLTEFLALKQGNNSVTHMPKLSTHSLNMLGTMWTQMRRSRLASGRGLAASFRIA